MLILLESDINDAVVEMQSLTVANSGFKRKR